MRELLLGGWLSLRGVPEQRAAALRARAKACGDGAWGEGVIGRAGRGCGRLLAHLTAELVPINQALHRLISLARRIVVLD